MKKLMLILCGSLPLFLTFSCTSRTQQPLCPRHIETPEYATIAKAAHVTGTVVMMLTIDSTGKVSDVKVENATERFVKLLAFGAVANVRLWTFAKPQSAPFAQRITYDFQLDDKLPLAGVDNNPDMTIVTYDLPGLVTIRANNHVVQTTAATHSR